MTDDKSPILQPYPSWDANEIPQEPSTTAETDELKVVSAVRIRVDECDRLWVIDSGSDEILGITTQLMPQSILIFDLTNDKFIRRFVIPPEQKKSDSFFANIVSFFHAFRKLSGLMLSFFRLSTFCQQSVAMLLPTSRMSSPTQSSSMITRTIARIVFDIISFTSSRFREIFQSTV